MPCACTAADMEITGAQLCAQVFFFFFLNISPLKIPKGTNLDDGSPSPPNYVKA